MSWGKLHRRLVQAILTHHAKRQSPAAELKVLETDEFIGHLEERLGRNRRREGTVEHGILGTAKTLGVDVRLDDRRLPGWIRQLSNRVIEQLNALPQELQRRVLEFTRALAQSTPGGIPGRQLLRFAGAISLDDVGLMREAIERGCEQVDTNEW